MDPAFQSKKAMEIFSKVIHTLKAGDELRLYCFYHRGEIYTRKGEFERALADFAMIIQHGAFLPQEKRRFMEFKPYYVRHNRAEIYRKMNDPMSAINELTLFLEGVTNFDDKFLVYEAYSDRAELFMQNGETDKALADYSAIIDMGFHESMVKEAFTARIEIFKTRGEMDKAFAESIKMSEWKKDDSSNAFDFSTLPKFEILN
jgi:tetratricopeptide (TPR) repeat protein